MRNARCYHARVVYAFELVSLSVKLASFRKNFKRLAGRRRINRISYFPDGVASTTAENIDNAKKEAVKSTHTHGGGGGGGG